MTAGPRVIIHGGAGRAFRDPARGPIVRDALHRVVAEVFEALESGVSAREAVVLGCRLLEDEPNFNAGTGSAIQSDGQIRMTAALMDGRRRAFSGITNVMRVQNPILLADYLQDFPDRVLSGLGAMELARERHDPIYDPATPRRLSEWLAERSRGFTRDPADVVAEDGHDDRRQGTIGVCVLDRSGNVAVGTSTGGRGFERVGRVSDSGMPAGTYASPEVAVSCTGIGEDIMDECLAGRIVVRVEDGMSIEDAMRRSMDEGEERGRMFGAIAVGLDGALVWGKNSDIMLAAWHDGSQISDCIDADPGNITMRVD